MIERYVDEACDAIDESVADQYVVEDTIAARRLPRGDNEQRVEAHRANDQHTLADGREGLREEEVSVAVSEQIQVGEVLWRRAVEQIV